MDIFRFIRSAISIPYALLLILLLIKPKPVSGKTKAVICCMLCGVVLVNSLVVVLFGAQLAWALLPVTVALPVPLIILMISKYRDGRLWFSVLTGFVFSMAAGFLPGTISIYHGSVLLNLIFKIFIYAVLLWALLKYFRRPFFEVLEQWERGWYTVCLIPGAFAAIFYLLLCFPVTPRQVPQLVPGVLAATAALFLVYITFYRFFVNLRRQYQDEADRLSLQTQIELIRRQEADIRQSVETTRILRHDLHHYLQIVMMHYRSGDSAEAEKVIQKLDHWTDDAAVKLYSNNLTINAALSPHIQRAEKDGIEVKALLDIPKALPLDDLELAVVFANAFENAANACRALPETEPRRIELGCRNLDHQLLLQISNSHSGPVLWDREKGIPVSEEDGHGIGSRSIAAFVQKHGALCSYEVNEQCFTLRILIPLA